MNNVSPYGNKQWRILLRIGFLLFTLFIVYVSTFPNLNDSDRELGKGFIIRLDYIFHFLVFLIWGLLLRFSIPSDWVKTFWHLAFVLILAFLFTSLSEYFQHYVPGRAYNPWDLVSNFGGLLLALIIHRVFPRSWNRFYRFLYR